MFRGFAALLTITGLAMGQAMVQHAAAAAGGAAAAAGSSKIANGLETLLGGAANTIATAAGPATAAAPKKQAIVAAAPQPPTGKRSKHSPFEPQVNRTGESELAPVVGAPLHLQIPPPDEVEAYTPSGETGNTPWISRRQTPAQGSVPAFTPFVTTDSPAPPAMSRGAHRHSPQVMIETAIIAPSSTSVVTSALVVALPVLPPPPTATPEKLATIREGSTYEQIVASLGKPASKIEMMEDGKVLESLRIESRGSKIGTIRLVDGVVTAVVPVSQ